MKPAPIGGQPIRVPEGRGIAEAVENLRKGACKPFAPKLPMPVAIRMRTVADADAAVANRPDSVERVDDFTVRGHA